MMNFLTKKWRLVVYFLITIVWVSSIGVWFPLVWDWFNADPKSAILIKSDTWAATPNNIITYFLSIFVISLVDRTLVLVDLHEYRFRKPEILFSAIVVGIVIFFVLKGYQASRRGYTDTAITYACVGALVSYAMWWLANYNDSKTEYNDSIEKLRQGLPNTQNTNGFTT